MTFSETTLNLMMKGEISLSSSGVIVELKNGRVIVMTKQFDFVEIKRKPQMASGQKISFKQEDIYIYNERHSGLLVKIVSIASIAAALLFIVLNLKLFNFHKDEFAYICMDINPSFEFIVGNEKKIIGVKAINNDAKVVMKDLAVKDENIKDALNAVIKKCINSGYLVLEEDNNAVLLSVALNPNNNKTGNIESDMKELLSEIDSIKNNFNDMNIRILKVSSEDRSAAKKAGMSMGRYYLYLKAKELSKDVSAEQIKQKSISELMEIVDNDKVVSVPDEKDETNETNKTNETNELDLTPTPQMQTPSLTPEPKNTNKPDRQEVATAESTKGGAKGNSNGETGHTASEPTMLPPEAMIYKIDKSNNTTTPIIHTPRVLPTSTSTPRPTPSQTKTPKTTNRADMEDIQYYTTAPLKPTPKVSPVQAYTPTAQTSIRPDPTGTKPPLLNTQKSTPTPTSTPMSTHTPTIKPTPSPTPAQVPQVIGFTLVNAYTGTDIRKIDNGGDVYLSEVGGVIKIRAEIKGNTDKVVFDLGDNKGFATVNDPPYTVKIDNVRFNPWMQAPIEQTITAVPYYSVNGIETEGNKLSIKINIKEYKPIPFSKDLKISSFVLVNSEDGRDIREIRDGEYISINEVGKTIKIRTQVNNNVQKVKFFMDPGMRFKLDEDAPYTFEIDTSSLNNFWGAPWGVLVINATPCSIIDGEETVGQSEVIKINIKYDDPIKTPPNNNFWSN